MKKLLQKVVLMTFISFSSNQVMAQWVQTNGPQGGEAKCLTSIDTILFVGTEFGVFRSTDNGASWISTGLKENANILSFAVKPSGNSDMNLFAGTTGGVYLSTDHGDSWKQVNFGLGNRGVNSLAVSDTNLFAGTEDGVFLSPSNGDYWIPAGTGLTNKSIHSLTVIANHLYAGTDKGLFISTDNGATWTPAGLTGERVNAFAAIGSNLFAGTDTSGVFRSIDNGANWEIISIPDMGRDVRALSVINDNLFAATGWGIYRTSTNGAYWIPANTGLTNTVVALYVRGTDLFAGTYGGVFRSTNYGENWTEVITGIIGTQVRSLVSSGTDLYAGIWGGIFRSSDNGNSWTPLATGSACFSLVIRGSNLYAGGVNHVGCYSIDNGNSWEWVPVAMGFVNTLAFSGTNLFAGLEGSGVFRITHNAPGWWTITPTNLKDTKVYSLAVKDTDIYAGTEGGIFRSTNNGVDWTAINNGLTNLDVRALAVNGANLFAGTSGGGVFLSTNDGASWIPVNNGLTGLALDVLSFVFSGNSLFVGTWRGGVFLSTDNGASWTAVNTGMMSSNVHPASVVHGLAIVGTDLYAGTRGAGVWQRSLSEMITSVKNMPDKHPMTFSLHQNYPNPFNHFTTIDFQVQKSARITIKIYDTLGREVRKLISSFYDAGNYHTTWDGLDNFGHNVSSGVYLYYMESIDFKEVKKPLLLK